MLEILAPAGNVECANAAIDSGANAIYLGLESFSARQGAENFTDSDFCDVIKRAHFCGVKVYVAMNTLVKDSEVASFLSSLIFAWNAGADAIILQDIFLGKVIKKIYPEVILHLSTQAGVCTIEGAKLAKEYGFSRVILARETPLIEIAEIASFMETEVFAQGALCTAYSGQCYFSSFVGGNSGNRGRCKQPCRKLYAYDRKGNEEKNYALSLSDLCVGEQLEKLIAAGVVSFKIEGRMRRAEYVAAAVRYYRGILDGANESNALSDLKRTYNRGNYTQGLAFGQDKRLLSTTIQGHIGEKVGVVKVIGGQFFVESAFKPQAGDGFKILRDGREIAGASYVKTQGRSFIIQSKIRLKNGDGVFVTTDTSVNQRVLTSRRQGSLHICLEFGEGELPKATCGEFTLQGEKPLQTAQNRPLSIEEIQACFLKTDGLPVQVIFDNVTVTGNIFIPKSELNAFRRTFYTELAQRVQKGGNRQYEAQTISLSAMRGKNSKTAMISNDFTGVNVDVAVYKWEDLRLPLPQSFLEGNFEKYLYYPAFATRTDLQKIQALLAEGEIDGVYAENYSAILFAKTLGVKVFMGTGGNLMNRLSIETLLEEDCVTYYAISKECNAEEGELLGSDRAFALSMGDIKLMDLCYCPFGKTCANCDKRQVYRLTDEAGRVFPIRRSVVADGSCRFEVYNCTSLIGTGIKGSGQLLDCTGTKDKVAALLAKDDETEQKAIYGQYTSGHYKRGVL